MRKRLSLAIGFVTSWFASFTSALAHCPLCTAAVGAGVAVTRVYGMDDTIAGVWVGAFIVSTALWFNRYLKKKYVPSQGLLLIIAGLIITIVSFSIGGLTGDLRYRIWGLDKLTVGMVAGTFVTYFAFILSKEIRERRNNKLLFPFQSIIIALAFLAVSSVVFWQIT